MMFYMNVPFYPYNAFNRKITAQTQKISAQAQLISAPT
jgi:hypothetical protein